MRLPCRWLALGLGLAAPVGLAAQRAVPDTALPGGALIGTVLDAATGHALAGAVVLLEPRPAGAVRPAAGGFWTTGVTRVTDALGGYRFSRLPPGEYRLLVRRLGYRPVVVDVDLRQADPLRLSVGMTVQPILLEPTQVSVARAPFTRVAGAAVDREALGRLDVELFRQREFLESDARALTLSDVQDAVTLGETDLFRALHRLPGVTTRDDFTAELWTRGAPWSHTRVYFDGMPLYNPLHTAGVFSGVNPDAVGAAFFHPGGRGAAVGEGAAAVLDLSSRPAGERRLAGAAELSAVSGRLALDGALGGRGGWMIAGRRSYVDVFPSYLDLLADSSGSFTDSAGHIPYAFSDLVSRVDLPLGGAATLELSGLVERDDLRGTVGTLLRDSRGHWGNAVARASIAAPLGAAAARHTLGVSRFAANVASPVVSDTGFGLLAPSHRPTANAITEIALRGEFETAGASRWAGGYELAAVWQRYVGPPPRAYPEVVLPDTLELSVRRAVVALWGERRWVSGPVAVRGGLRVELPGHVANAPPVAVAPRVSARIATGPTVAVSVAYARTWQYTQAIGAAGPGLGPDLHLSDVWLMADDTLPAIRSDLATVGLEAWLGGGWLGAATLYGRYGTGIAVPDPTPGLLQSGRPLFVAGENRAGGLELSARHLVGRVTGSVAYSEGLSETRAAGFVYPSSAERRRVLDATAMARLGAGFRGGAAFTAASGAPYTRFVLGAVVPGGGECDTIAPCDTLYVTNAVEEPNANRAPSYLTLDLVGEWAHAFGSWTLGAYLQLRNVLGRTNAVTYVGTLEACEAAPPTRRPVPAAPDRCDAFDRGLPLLPLVGVSVRF